LGGGSHTKASHVAAKSKDIKLASAESIKNDAIYLQVGAFSKIDNARQLSTKIAKFTENHPTQINHSASLYRVQIGPLASATQSNILKRTLEANGFDKVVAISN
jgi:cell division protein FtsN